MGNDGNSDPDELNFDTDSPIEDLELDEEFWPGEDDTYYDPFQEGIPVIGPDEDY